MLACCACSTTSLPFMLYGDGGCLRAWRSCPQPFLLAPHRSSSCSHSHFLASLLHFCCCVGCHSGVSSWARLFPFSPSSLPTPRNRNNMAVVRGAGFCLPLNTDCRARGERFVYRLLCSSGQLSLPANGDAVVPTCG